MPMGVVNAPMMFSKIMNQILGDCEFLVIYIDDICIFSRTLDEHLTHIEMVMHKLEKANIKINQDKCKWIAEKVKLLGHIVSGTGIEMNPEKTKCINDRKAPSNVKEVQQFLGICNYYRKFIKGFAEIAVPLYNLLKIENKWNWTDECQKAFETLKVKLTSYPVLRQPDMGRMFSIFTDASIDAVGAVLSQTDDDGNEYVVAYASKTFKSHEKHMGISEKEMAACVFGVREFRHYIFGTHFKLITDHNALKYLMSIKDPTGKLARWSIFLSQFDFEISYKKGSTHSNADYLSRQ